MEVKAAVTVPRFVYEIYAAAAKKLEGYTTEQVMSGALQAYAQCLFEEMRTSGELPYDAP